MYEGHFGLRTAPFHITPDPNLLLLTEVHKEALGAILYGVRARKGFVSISGEVGVGKTTVLRAAFQQLDEARADIIYMVQPPGTPQELLRALHAELTEITDNPGGRHGAKPAPPGAAPAAHRDLATLVAGIHVQLLQAFERGRIVVVAIDEAQLLSVETLEALRLLSNFETRSAKLLQIVLVGQPELDELLSRRELRQLAQRIAVRATITPLGPAESRHYVEHRLSAATDRPMRIFTGGALRTLLRAGEGYPRRLNVLCDNALMNAYGHGSHTVTTRIAREAVRMFAAQERRAPARRPLIWMAAGAACIGLVGIVVATAPWWRDSVPAALAAEWAARSSLDAGSNRDPGSAPAIGREAVPARPDAEHSATVAPPSSTAAEAPDPPPSRTTGTASAVAGKTAESPVRATDEIARKLSELMPAPAPRARNRAPGGEVVIRTVARGDTVSRLCSEIYGECGSDEISLIRAANPRIRDLSRVMVGQAITFPAPPPAGR